VSFASLHDHVISQFDFQTTKSSFSLFLLLKKSCFFGIANTFVFCVVDSQRERFVSLTKLSHLRMLLQLGLLLERQLRRDVCIDRQIGKPSHFLNHLVRELPKIAELDVKSNLLIQIVIDNFLLIIKELISHRSESAIC